MWFVEYLTNYRSIFYNLIVIFPLKGEPRLLFPSPVQQYWAGLLSWIPNVQEEITGIGESVVRSVGDMGLRRSKLGLINDKIMPADVYLLLVKALPDATIADSTGIIEELRMIKTPPEQELVRGSARLAHLSLQG